MGIKLTVYFDDPFWVGVFERGEAGWLETVRVVFGAEPKDCEVYEYIRFHFNELAFSRPLDMEADLNRKISPKRLQRKIRQELSATGVGTKAQQAIKLEREAGKAKRRSLKKACREAQEERKFELRQAKKKAKRKGH